MPTALPNEKTPKFNSVITPEFLQAVALSENQAKDPRAVNENDLGEAPDYGLAQVNEANTTKLFKDQFGFSPQVSTTRGLPSNVAGPANPILFDPYINTRLAFGLLEELHTNLSKMKETKGFNAMSVTETQEALFAAYKSGQGGFANRWQKEGKYWLTDKDHIIRTQRLRNNLKKPVTNQFLQYLDKDETRKRAVVRGRESLEDIELTLASLGYKKHEPTPAPPTPEILKQVTAQPIMDAAKALAGGPPTVPKDTSFIGGLLSDIQDKATEFEEFAKNAPNLTLEVLGNVGKALDLPGRIIRGVGVEGMPGSVDELLNNSLDATGVKFNKATQGVPLPEEIETAKQEFIDKQLAAGKEPSAEALEEFDKSRNYSENLGLMTEVATSVPPFLPLVKPLLGIGGAAKPIAKATAKKAASKETAISIYEEARKEVERATSLVSKTAGDTNYGTKFSEEAFDAGMAEDVIFGDLGRDLPKGAPMQELRGTGKVTDFNTSTRVQDAALDAMEKIGPLGEAISKTILNSTNRAEQATGIIFSRIKGVFEDIAGRRIISALNPIKRASTTKYFNVSQTESDAIVEMMYRGNVNPTKTVRIPGKSVVDPSKPGVSKDIASKQAIDFTKAPWNIPPERVEKLQAIADRLYKEGTFPTSTHRGVRQLEIMLPDGKHIPVGQHSMFFPQVPVNVQLKDVLHGRRFETMFKIAKRDNKDLTRFEYRDQLTRMMHAAGRVKGRGPEAHFAGLENARMFDAAKIADETGSTVAKVLRDYGYESDPIKSIISFTSGAQRRGEIELIHDPLMKMAGKLEEQMLAKNPNHAKFPEKVTSHFLNIDQKELMDQAAKGWTSAMLNVNNVSLLQMAAPSNMAQLAFVFSRGSLGSFTKGAMRSVRDVFRPGNPLAERSGALFIEMIQEWTTPSTMLGRMTQDAFRATGFTGVNRAIRSFAANVGMYDTLRITKNLAKDPTNKKWINAVEELGLNHKVVIDEYKAIGGLSENNLARAVQNFANRTANREGITGVPAWASTNKDLARVMLQYKKFALANHAEARRQFINAPSVAEGAKRVGKLLFGAEIAGELINDFRHIAVRFSNPFDPSDLDRDGKPRSVKETLGAEMAERAADNIFTAYGTIFAMFVSSASQGSKGVYRFFAPPGVATVAEFSDDPTETLARRVPGIGPQLETVVKEKKKRTDSGSLGNIGTIGELPTIDD